ncbi:MAG: hypothetical protein ACRCX8_09945 [Sarcina sp.]
MTGTIMTGVGLLLSWIGIYLVTKTEKLHRYVFWSGIVIGILGVIINIMKELR